MGLSPNIRIYRYSPSQFFDAHCMLLCGVNALPPLGHFEAAIVNLTWYFPVPHTAISSELHISMTGREAASIDIPSSLLC